MAEPAKAGVMGWPIAHSLSPRLHSYWLRQYGIDGIYEPMAVAPEQLADELRDLAAQGFRGVNLTIPHKEAALAVMAQLDPVAKRIGAVNLVIVQPDGSLKGRNTDAFGFTQNLQSVGVDVKDKPAVILGGGGAARAVAVALQDLGASEIRLVNRTMDRAEKLAQDLGGNIKTLPLDAVKTAFDGAALLVNATSRGMHGQPLLDITLDGLPPDAGVADLVYVPLQTELLQQAQQRGHKTVDGLGMLLHQARPAFAAFFGRDPEVTPALRNFVLEAR